MQITTGFEEEFEAYWIYFVKTWIHTYKPVTWNVHHLITDENGNRRETFEGTSEEEIQIYQRTNNCIERFNRTMNESFPTPHPNLPQFIRTIQEHSSRCVERIRRMSRGDEEAPRHNTTLVFGFPPLDYN